MASIDVPWGDKALTLTMPEGWSIQQVAESNGSSAGGPWRDRLAQALHEPAAGKPLDQLLSENRNGKIVIILEDLTRHSPLPEILPLVMREIKHVGIREDQVSLIFACGMHPVMTPREVAEKIGPAMSHLRWRCNPWEDESQYVKVGTVGKMDIKIDREVAQADVRIIVSSVSVHVQAGFGGGYKMFFPGVASIETIRQIHKLGLQEKQSKLVGTYADTNPMRRAIDAAGQLVDQYHGASFAVQYLLNDENQPSFIAAGDVVPVQQMLAKQCSNVSGVLLENQADIVVTNAFPRDHDLWQSFKSVANTRWSCRPDGVVICLSRCQAAMEGMNVPKWPISPKWLRRILQWIGSNAITSLVTRLKPDLASDATFFVRLATQILQRNPIIFVSPILATSGGKFPGLEVVATFEEAVEIARQWVGTGPQRVTVYPTGGTSFALTN
jgi:nickel-dependent lactate racemase